MTESSKTGGPVARSRPRRRRALDAATARVFKLPRGRHEYLLTEAVRVRMRDGVELLTDVYTPVGDSRGTILIRTPYGRSGLIAALTARYLATCGFLVVNQSCRGTFGSGGSFELFRPDIDDGADAVAWLRRQPWFDGRFALYGSSYLGWTAWAIMTDPPPELATAVISIAAHDNHALTHGSGAFALEPTLSLFDGMRYLEKGPLWGTVRSLSAGRRLRPGFEELPLVRAQETVLAGDLPYRDWLLAPEAEDPLWRPMRLGAALDRVNVPVLLQEGWQDRFVDQMTEQYDRLHRRGVEVALTVGPWTHVDVATRAIGEVMAETLDWLDQHLTGRRRSPRPAPVRVFVTGAEEWRHLPAWPPPASEHVLYLQPGGRLGRTPPASGTEPSTFTYDPADPTPSVGGGVINPALGGRRDNRKLEARPDVLVFTSPVLDDPLEVIGNPVVELVHESDNPYADLFVRLCEVAPTGRSVNLSDAYARLDPEATSGPVRLRLEATAHRFRPGTRVRLQVSGGAHPRYARNLGTDEHPATGTTLAPSHRTIAHGDGRISRLVLPTPT